ncbi:MAG TPA: hypothetical protein VK610_10285, partial [Rhodothermales bacterium]|nr:hypothetical protein [Rhodothermales bacterium]
MDAVLPPDGPIPDAPTPAGPGRAARLRPTLVLLCTLALGVLLGALLNGYLARQRFERLDRMRGREGFVTMMEGVVAPTSEAQRAAIQPALERESVRARTLFQDFRARMRANQDSLLTELRPHLTPEQLARVRDRLYNGRRGRHGDRHGGRHEDRPGDGGP